MSPPRGAMCACVHWLTCPDPIRTSVVLNSVLLHGLLFGFRVLRRTRRPQRCGRSFVAATPPPLALGPIRVPFPLRPIPTSAHSHFGPFPPKHAPAQFPSLGQPPRPALLPSKAQRGNGRGEVSSASTSEYLLWLRAPRRSWRSSAPSSLLQTGSDSVRAQECHQSEFRVGVYAAARRKLGSKKGARQRASLKVIGSGAAAAHTRARSDHGGCQTSIGPILVFSEPMPGEGGRMMGPRA